MTTTIRACEICADMLVAAGARYEAGEIPMLAQCEHHTAPPMRATRIVDVTGIDLPPAPLSFEEPDPKEVGPVTTIAAQLLSASFASWHPTETASLPLSTVIDSAVEWARALVRATKGA